MISILDPQDRETWRKIIKDVAGVANPGLRDNDNTLNIKTGWKSKLI